jgi:DNA-binding GntR family transcriptional regulator
VRHVAFRPMAQPSLVEMAAAELREAIVSGRLRPGTKISDHRVAEEMGISRAPVREAIRQLAARGLTEEIPRRGAFVARLTSGGVNQVYECRRALEGLAARRIATGAGGAGAIGRLQAIVHEMDDAGDPLLRARIDHRFHRTLCDLTGNDWLVRLYEQLADQSLMMQAIDAAVHADADRRDLVIQHQPIVDAIATGKEDRAEEAIVAHIDLAERLFLQEVPDLEKGL